MLSPGRTTMGKSYVVEHEVPTRPLPMLTPWNEWFWTSGCDGVLRFAQCRDCDAWIHPMEPMCTRCRSTRVGPASVSGNATVVAVTVNTQPWLAAMPPPYVIAVVAMDEDAGLRLTTNIVDCQAESVHIGQRVAVRFEQHDDVWLPVFAPTGAPDGDGTVEPPERFATARVSGAKFEDRVVISGIGQSEVGRRLMVNPVGLTVAAVQQAVADAGLELDDIDGVSTYPGATGNGMSEGGVPALVEALRLQPVWVNGGGEIPGQAGSIIAAMLAVSSGLCRHVVCFRTVWEASWAQLGREGRLPPPALRVTGAMLEYRMPWGAPSAANWIALAASQYLHRYGADREMLGWIAVNARRNATMNPEAVYRDPLTLDDYFSARMVSSPFGLYDCDVPCDGAVAVIVSAADTTSSLRAPVGVEAVGTRITERLSWDQGTLTHMPQAWGPAAHLWTRTDTKPADVDVAEIYDGFTFNCISWLEALGFCGTGEAAEFVAGGSRIALHGELPLNTHGGQLSAGRTHGYGYVREAVRQLRGEAGDRQVRAARLAAVAVGGGVPAGCMLLRRLDA
jgi:acetyl-CoA acetyltransferase/uncharacterized OB-fold protein